MSLIRQFILQDPNDNTRLGEFDSIFSVPVIIDAVHHTVHDEIHYSLSAVQTGLNDGDTFTLTCITPNSTKRLHTMFDGNGLFEYYLRVYESPTISANGTTVTPVNSDFGSSNTSDATFRVDDTFTSLGTIKYEEYISSGSRQGGAGGQRSERILKANTTYVFYLESDQALNIITGILEWYEKVPD